MPNKVNGIIDRIKNTNSWLRILLMFGYLVVLYVIALLAVVIMIAQTLFVFASGSPNSNLVIFGEALAEYIKQIIDFLFYKSNTKPFPFAPFPIIDFIANSENLDQEADVKSTPKTKSSPKKKVAKKSAKVKSTAKKTS
ncbi:MAG: DUF4389 domain-containing protein [Pseudohongiellaceae bacterium]